MLWNVPGLGMNEGGCDSDGRFPGLFPFAGFPAAAGYPDGLTVDSDGGVWVAVYGGSAVRPVREFAG
ncbi:MULTISPECIES: SMP-30/gluconolactonase/LRE family protein [unclassified Cryobacterium]|uniref:SMP-30/gluconolactonase/LRE family protein n=1 Tax=unclassified Cryobacterium TaxID=2649013 RepID=UPI0018E0B7E9|nr:MULTISPECIES: SMP-30/gluconolactonase/LRE family protein [unclassified Cryobacterium]